MSTNDIVLDMISWSSKVDMQFIFFPTRVNIVNYRALSLRLTVSITCFALDNELLNQLSSQEKLQ